MSSTMLQKKASSSNFMMRSREIRHHKASHHRSFFFKNDPRLMVVIEALVDMHRLKDYPATKLFGVDSQRIMYQLLKGVAHTHRALTPINVYFGNLLVKITHLSESELTLTTNSNCLTA
ncbi:hypothetical protein Pyn_08108 [Prunus yedoensis var. nudiflora]|uniref:Uncharacterized protein n=1 Tax=Prunus yedoensis var. nudiflora TaxID=2094558 RepID=A0A314XVD2_PRUYE|nr:hypothetical protein Pyn_08108 [Prunus yedoensis var. nudiflora]